MTVPPLATLFRPHQAGTVDDAPVNDWARNQSEQTDHHQDQPLRKGFVLLGDASKMLGPLTMTIVSTLSNLPVIDQQIANAAGSSKAVDNTGNDGKQIESHGAPFQTSSRNQPGSEGNVGAGGCRAGKLHLIHLSTRSIREILFGFLA